MSEAATATPPPGPSATPPPPAGSQPATVQAPFNDAFADLDKMIGGDDSPPSDAGTPPAESTSGPSDTPASSAKTAEPSGKDKSGGTPKAAQPSSPSDQPVEKMAPKQLREAYANLKSKMAEIQKERDGFKEQLSKPPPEDPEKKTLAERLTAREKRIQEIEDILRLKAYEEHPEYKQKWHQPFIDAYSRGRDAVSRIKVNNDDGELRQGTTEDWDAYMRIQDEDQASEFAERVFGNKKGMVEYHRMQAIQKNDERKRAIEENKKVAADLEKQHAELQEQQKKVIGEFWTKSNEDAAKKYPQWFAPTEGDEKGNELLARGMHLADRAFSSGQPLADGDKPLNPKDLVSLHNAVRNKAGAFDRLAYQHAQAQKKIKALETKLAAFEASVPGQGEGKRGEPAGEPLGWEAELEKRAHRA